MADKAISRQFIQPTPVTAFCQAGRWSGASMAHKEAVAETAEETALLQEGRGERRRSRRFARPTGPDHSAAEILADPAFLFCGGRWWGGRDGVVAKAVFEEVEGALGASPWWVLRCRGLRGLSA
jgi:hypothetical protein